MTNIDHLTFEYEQSGVEATGPFQDTHYVLTVNGYTVPYLRAYLMKGTEDTWLLRLDRRFGHEVTDAELRQLLPLFANAMAVAAGFTHHGEGAEPYNRYKTKQNETEEGGAIQQFGQMRLAYYQLLYAGHPLPYLKARKSEREGHWMIEVDDRLEYEIAETTLDHTIWLLANAMAVAADYSFFGKKSALSNRYRGQLMGITAISKEEM